MKKVQLFCIPYSGGSANVFEKWLGLLKEEIQLCPIELAGKGKRIIENTYSSVEEAAVDIADNIMKKRDTSMDYAIWGHSLGALLAYEAYYCLIERTAKLPIKLFFSGRGAPHCRIGRTSYYLLPDDKFLEMLYDYGGNTKEIMEHEELRKLFFPILRSDFKLSETYVHKDKQNKIMCDVHIVNGDNDDSVANFNMEEWKDLSGKGFKESIVTGGHFFITENLADTAAIINNAL